MLYHQPPNLTSSENASRLSRDHLTLTFRDNFTRERVPVALKCSRLEKKAFGKPLPTMAPRSRRDGNDTDVSMADAPEPSNQVADDMVGRFKS